jgi:hypothetical protein
MLTKLSLPARRLRFRPSHNQDPVERSTLTNVTPGRGPGDRDITGYALARWDRTARLCAIRLAEASPVLALLVHAETPEVIRQAFAKLPRLRPDPSADPERARPRGVILRR